MTVHYSENQQSLFLFSRYMERKLKRLDRSEEQMTELQEKKGVAL